MTQRDPDLDPRYGDTGGRELGIHPDLPEAEYHALDRLSSSMLRANLEGLQPGHIRHDGAEPETGSVDLDIGTAVHTAVLQPDQWDSRIVEALDLDRRSNANKATWAEFELANAGKILLKPDALETARSCAAALLAHPMVRFDLASGTPELTALWCEPVGPYLLPCKARADWYNETEGILLDLKTTRHRGLRAVEHEIIDRRYYAQLAWYRHGLRNSGKAVKHCCVAIVEKAPPYGVLHYELPEAALTAGWRAIERQLEMWAWCYAHEQWPLYSEENITWEPPAWMLAQA